MICCNECFADLEIRAIIEACGHKGECPLCGKRDVWLYDSEKDIEESGFQDLMESVLEIYKSEDELQNTYPEDEKMLIEERLERDWKLFSVNQTGIKKIVEDIIWNSLVLDERILTQRVGIPELYDESYLVENSIMGPYSWEDFKKYLRNENRFHSKYINLNVLEEILKDTEITISEGTNLYRARISNEKGFKRKEMWAPPNDIASPGRANSKGISCLYLANKRKTTVKEIRANAFDYVTIATFKLKKAIRVVDLSVIVHNSPFYANTDKIKYLVNEKHLRKIERDLSKPLTKRDSDLDYLPTQYISDFAKFLGYDGVKYLSTFDKESYNVALFDSESCDCIYHRNYLIGDLNYKLEAL